MFHNRKLRCPVRSPAYAVNGDAGLVDFMTGFDVVDHPREHAVGGLADLDGSLACAGAIDGEVAHPKGQNAREILRKIFLAAIEAIDGKDDGNGSGRIFRQAQVAGDSFAFEGNVYHLERWIEKLGVREESFNSFRVRLFLSGRRGHGPAAEGIEPPRTNVV